ncbi:MAG: PAS domain-containing protein [Rhodospirillales bacterium]
MPGRTRDKSGVTRQPEGGGDRAGLDDRILDFARAGSDWLWETDADSRFTYLSEGVFEAIGLAPDYFVGKTRDELYDSGPRGDLWDDYKKVLASKEPFRDFTFLVPADDGTACPVAVSGVPVFEDGEFTGYRGTGRRLPPGELVGKLVSNVVDATSQAVGRDFLKQISVSLCRELRVDIVLIGGISDDGTAVETMVAVESGRLLENFRYELAGSPCETVVSKSEMCVFAHGVADQFPRDVAIREQGIEGYVGIPLMGSDGGCSGLIVAMCRSALVLDQSCNSVLQFFAGRVSAEIERARSEETLRNNEVLLSAIVDNIPHGLTVKSPEGRYILVNKEFSSRYGVKTQDIMGGSNEEMFPDWESAWALSRAQEKDVAAQGKNLVREQERRFADGSEHLLEIIKFPIWGDNDTLLGVGALGVDITETRERERVLKGYHEALDRLVSSDALASPDAAEAFGLLTQVAAETLGVERVSVWQADPGISRIECLDIFTLSADRHDSGAVLERDFCPEYFNAMQQVEVIDAHDARTDPRTREFADGYLDEYGITSMLDAAIHVGDELKGVLCLEHVGEPRQWTLEEQSLARSLAALTSMILARREHLEAERARQSVEQRFSEVVNALPSSLSLKDKDQRYVFVNRVYEQNYGVTAAEANGKTIAELGLNNEDILKNILEEDTAVLEQGKTFTKETTRIGRDGVTRSALVSKFPVYDQDGNIELIATLWTDISEQKNVQKTLEDARSRLRAITDNVPMMLCLKGLDCRFLDGNAPFADWHGVTVKTLPGKTSKDLLSAERARVVEDLDERVIQTGEVIEEVTVSQLHTGRDGEPTIFRMIKYPVKDDVGNITGVGTAMMDITRETVAQQSLQATQARLTAITENVPIMLGLKDMEGRIQACNAAFAEWHGLDKDSMIGKTIWDFSTQEIAKLVDDIEREVKETGEVRVSELPSVRNMWLDGTPRVVRMVKFPVKDAHGAMVGVGTAVTDITEQKLAQRELEETQARLFAITDNVPIMLSLKGKDGVYQHCNPSFLEWHSFSGDQIIGKTSRDILPPDRAEEIEKLDRAVLETGEVQVFETETVLGHLKNDEPVILRQFKFPIRDGSGEVSSIGTALLDITDERRAERALQGHLEKLEDMVADRTVELTQEIAERRRAEAELRQSEQNLRSVLEKSPVGVAVVARNPRRRLFVNDSFLEMLGAETEEQLNAVPMAETYADAHELEKMSKMFDQDGNITAVEVQRIRLDGRKVWLLMHARLVEFEGESAALVWHYDITTRKEAEEALARQAELLEQTVAERTRELRENESLLSSIIEHLPVGVLIKDAELRLERANSAYMKWYGVDTESLVGKTDIVIEDIQSAEDAAMRAKQEQVVLTTGEIQTREAERRFIDGRMHTVNITKFPIRDDSGKVVRIGSVSVDMTEQVESRKALERHERLLRSLIDNLPVGITVTNQDMRYNLVNSTFCNWYGLTNDMVVGNDIVGVSKILGTDGQVIRQQEATAWKSGKKLSRETERNFADGSLHNLLITKYPFLDESGEVAGVVSVSVDLTDLRARERELTTLVENVPGAVFRTFMRFDGRIEQKFISEGIEEISGYTPEELVAAFDAGDYSLVHPDDIGDMLRLPQVGAKIGEAHESKFRLVTKDGRVKWVFRRSRIVEENEDGFMVEGLLIDITEQKLADDALRQNQAWLSAFTDNLPIYLNLKDPDGRYLFVNRLFKDIRKDRNIRYEGKTVDEAFPDHKNYDELLDIDKRILVTGEVADFESPAKSPELDGKLLRFIKFPVRDGSGEVIGIGTAAMDITDQKKAENAIRENEAKLQAITQNAPMLLTLKDLDGRYQFVNESYSQWVKKPVEDIIGKTLREVFDRQHADEIIRQEAMVIRTGEAAEFETTSLTEQEDGLRTMQYIKFPVRDGEGKMFGIGTAIMDVTERKRADVALKESEARFRGLFENAPAGITIKTISGRYLAMNKTFLDWKGWDLVDVVGRRTTDLFTEDEGLISGEEDAQVVGNRTPIMKEVVIKCADGRNLVTTNITAPMLTPDGDVTGICSFYVDVSEIREIEAQLQQAQKMEAIGRLAGSIAHDFNNLLGAMMGFNEFLIEDLEDGTPQHNFAERVAKAGERAKQLVSQILAFSRASHGEQTVIDLNAIGEEAATLLSGTLPVTTRVVFSPSDAEVIALTNAGQMSQVLMNLGVNANDAFSGADGVVSIGVERISAGSKALQVHEGPVKTTPEDFMEIREAEDGAWQVVAGAIEPDADHVLIYVEDTGPGIPEHVLRRIFDPFFTTKEAGKGTGLGLAVVHGIVTAHHGAVCVHTKAGEGTRFEVFLPCAVSSEAGDAADEMKEQVSGQGMILIVDDERDVADMVSIGLERLGYEVGVCAGGEEALEVFKDTPDLWRAVISDQIMPDMRGMDLVRQIKAIRADIPCILCTGYSDTLTEETARAGGADAFFQKPVSAARIGRMLADFLGEKS